MRSHIASSGHAEVRGVLIVPSFADGRAARPAVYRVHYEERHPLSRSRARERGSRDVRRCLGPVRSTCTVLGRCGRTWRADWIFVQGSGYSGSTVCDSGSTCVTVNDCTFVKLLRDTVL